MKLSTKGRYGLRAMVDLAANAHGEHVSLNNIADRQGISDNYLEQVFSVLRKAEIVKSVKGAQGGYALADKASNIKVGFILRALEGNLSVVEEEAEESEISANAMQGCLKSMVWDKINQCINGIVDSMTLEDLAFQYKKLKGEGMEMFYI